MGFADENVWVCAGKNESLEFPARIEGHLIYGTQKEAMGQARGFFENAQIKAGIVFLGNCGGEDAFVKELRSFFPGVPFVGGSPAIGEDGKRGRMLPESGEVSILLITDENYEVKAEYCNVHHEVIGEVEALGCARRHIDAIKTKSGERVRLYDYIHSLAGKKGVCEGIYNHFAVSDRRHKNIHLIPDESGFICGADLPESRKILVRYTDSENVYRSMKKFYADDNALIFGCAGVKAMLGDKKILAGRNSAGLFMFGEVASIENKPVFANLMLSKLIFNKKAGNKNDDQ